MRSDEGARRSGVDVYRAEVLFEPRDPALEYLPECPYPCGDGRLSWVAIQHGEAATHGSLNILDVATRRNRSWVLEGRPGFAFPTTDPQVFLVGCEKTVGFFHLDTETWSGPSVTVETDNPGTIINDGLLHEDVVVFGTKDLAFQTPQAALYFWRPRDGRLTRLAGGQTCSNGKVIRGGGNEVELLDIDTATRTVVSYALDLREGSVGAPRVVLDLREEAALPDGMILTPDRRSVVIAFYHPGEAPFGEARQYGLETGAVEVVWRTEASPQVTCPQWLRVGGEPRLVLTTAVEHMPPEKRKRYPLAGALFLAGSPWPDVAEPPPFTLPAGV